MSGPDPVLDLSSNLAEDRFARFRLIAWWDQELLSRARVLVVGAGALGNELLKDLALLGVGQILVADMDRIELSNLSRSILFRAADEGQPKAVVAARAAREIYPELGIDSFTGDVTTQLGLGAFAWADVVLGGLDNREARLFINRACLKVGTPWVDGAIEALQGIARAFAPGEAACYECSLTEADWKVLEARRACTLLTRAEMEGGRVPTTPTTSAVIAGVQCQEALKLMHGLEGVLLGSGFVFDGLHHQSYQVNYTRNPDCLSHALLDGIFQTGLSSEEATLGQLLELGRQAHQQAAPESSEDGELVLDFERDVIRALRCEACQAEEQVFRPLGSMTEQQARCPRCEGDRTPLLLNHVTAADDALLDLTVAQVGLPLWDVLVARVGERRLGLELDADRGVVLGRAGRLDEAAEEETP